MRLGKYSSTMVRIWVTSCCRISLIVYPVVNKHSYWTWPFSALIYLLKTVIFRSFLYVYQRVICNFAWKISGSLWRGHWWSHCRHWQISNSASLIGTYLKVPVGSWLIPTIGNITLDLMGCYVIKRVFNGILCDLMALLMKITYLDMHPSDVVGL